MNGFFLLLLFNKQKAILAFEPNSFMIHKDGINSI